MNTTTKGRRRTTTAAGTSRKAEKIRELNEQLEKFEAATDPAVIAAAVARFEERYSLRNVLLILMQRPDATLVNGFQQWKELGRQVRKGEHGILITAYAGSYENSDGDEKARFRGAYVFDISQTDPIPNPVPVPERTPEEQIAEALRMEDEYGEDL